MLSNIYGSGGGSGSSLTDESVTETFELDAADILAGGVTLANTVSDPLTVTMDVVSGVPQANVTDFAVAGNFLSWAGLGYDSLAEIGDILIVNYTVNIP